MDQFAYRPPTSPPRPSFGCAFATFVGLLLLALAALFVIPALLTVGGAFGHF